jgi:hypothetical protein
MTKALLTLIIAVSSQLAPPPQNASAEQICTAITDSSKEYVGCTKRGYEYILTQSINGIKKFSAYKENAHNPRCYDINTNGIIAICTYKR